MLAFTFTANAGTDEITTSSPHGLATGDGPGAVRNVGGALPTGLAALTDYWFIVTGASTLKVATSSANAMSNVFIDITAAGTGTHHLELGIPYRRPRTYVVGSQLKSDDLNDNFDAWVALYGLLTGQAETVWNGDVSLAGDLAVAGLMTASAGLTAGANQHVTVSGTGRFKHGDIIRHVPTLNGTGAGWAWDNTNGYLASTGAGTWSVGIPTIVGWRVKSITFERFGDGAADLTGGINRRAKDAAPDVEFAISVVNAAVAWIDTVCDISDKDISDGDSMWIYFTASAANLRIGEIRVTYAMI